MAKKLMVAGLTGRIFDVGLSRKGTPTDNQTERTDECITAVAEHMKHKADTNKEHKGFWQYEWKGLGTLTWQSEKKDIRRELNSMPFDRDGMHATGYEVCQGEVDNPADWWIEYEDDDGNLHYFR